MPETEVETRTVTTNGVTEVETRTVTTEVLTQITTTVPATVEPVTVTAITYVP